MATYIVVIEAPGLLEEFTFEADSQEEANEIGRDMFFDVCNYGVHQLSPDE